MSSVRKQKVVVGWIIMLSALLIVCGLTLVYCIRNSGNFDYIWATGLITVALLYVDIRLYLRLLEIEKNSLTKKSDQYY